ncbi:helix-turn-helix domain-containing protein [Propionibacterium freudenreichii]|uniref:helix-turn-helix domain-containing protein n=1 Tax=Propionibacterium freudenreichii TaxID=1744 RepID=UPI003D70DA31
MGRRREVHAPSLARDDESSAPGGPSSCPQRARQRVTFEQLAAASGLSRSAIANYIGGHRDIPLSALVSMSAALDTDPRAIFSAAEDAIQEPRRPDAS